MIAAYLNDHLGGSELALELLERITNTSEDAALGQLARRLHAEISEDRNVLESVMQKIEVSKSLPRTVTGWLGEKATTLKLALDGRNNRSFALFEAFEALCVGIEGKRLLWRALAEARPMLADYPRLIARAEDQRRRVEEARLSLTRAALP